MRKDSTINALRENTLSRDKATEVIFTARKGKEVQLPKTVTGKKKKGKLSGLSMGQMMVNQEVVLGSVEERTREIKEGDEGSQSEVKKAKVSGVIEQSRSYKVDVASLELQNVLRKEEIPPTQEKVQQQVPQLGQLPLPRFRLWFSTLYLSIFRSVRFNEDPCLECSRAR
ncbi:hypothetical protein QYF36_001168 [Acer negundo]|nr:hypothetical protein QYF36_001168 [Acer negundo]